MIKNKERDFLFDNYKVFLVLLVVVGHFIELSYQKNEFLYHLKWLIVSFHMPAFIFISGYFSKKEIPIKTLIYKLVIPYLVYELMYYFLYVYIIQKETGLYLFRPKFSLWYLQALFIWRVITPYVKRIPHYMVFSVVAALAVGATGIPGNFLSIPRVLVFYPFFLAGISFQREMITRFRTKKCKVLALGIVAAFTTYLVTDTFHRGYSPKIFYGRYNYDYLGQGAVEGMIVRLLCLAVGLAMTFAVMVLISEKKTFYSYIGGRTMAVYLFHGLLYSYLKGATNILEGIDTPLEIVLLLGSCVGVTAVLSAKQFTTFTNAVAACGKEIEGVAEEIRMHFPEWVLGFEQFWKCQAMCRAI